MRSKSLRALLVLLSISVAASVHSQTEDPIQALKDSLTQGSGSILQDILGKGSGAGKKSDQKLQTPETIQTKPEQSKDLFEKENKEKTRDDRILRQFNEDPELRADDTVLIEMNPVEDICKRYGINMGGQIPNTGNNP